MPKPHKQLQHLLLDILSTQREVKPSDVTTLSSSDWQHILLMSRQHRLGPMLYWRLKHDRSELPIPTEMTEKLAATYQRTTWHALAVQREMRQVHHVLHQLDIPHAFLKGAFLAFHAYPNPGLRPLRDLDCLVKETDALRAFHGLCEAGLIYPEQSHSNLEAKMQLYKHLPSLLTAKDSLQVELHTRLVAPENRENQYRDLVQAPDLWQRIQKYPVAGIRLPFLASEYLLLHLVIHAAYDHQFNNGSLIITDIAYLLEQYSIDWPRFWQLAKYTGHTRGCLLLLKIVEHYFGEQPILWLEIGHESVTIPSNIIKTASLLTLRDWQTKGLVRLGSKVAEQESIADKISVLYQHIFPPRKVIAAQCPVSERSPFIYCWYGVYWYRAFIKVISNIFPVLQQRRQTRQEMQDILRCKKWLNDTA